MKKFLSQKTIYLSCALLVNTLKVKQTLKYAGIPTTIMTYVLIKFTLLSGAYTEAWKLLDIYNTYSEFIFN